MKKTGLIIFLFCMGLGIAHVMAQDKKKKKTTTSDPAIIVADDDDQPVVHNSGKDTVRYFLLPEFYSPWPIDNNDTILKYECYDINHHPIDMDTLTNTSAIHSISLIKTHYDYLHTHIDADGTPRPRSITTIPYKYERTSPDSWTALDVVNNYRSELDEDKHTIVRQDTTVVTNAANGRKHLTVRKYYKTTEVEGDAKASAERGEGGNEQNNAVTTYVFTVPEFYFHRPQQVKDTTYEFFCYDSRDSVMGHISDYDSVHYYSLYKSYIDSTHHYKDDNGNKKPLPVSAIVKRFDRIGKDKWMCVQYPHNKYTELKDFKNVIVSSDSDRIVDAITGNEELLIYNHYKVVK